MKNKDYYKRYNKERPANPFSMNQRKIQAKALRLDLTEFIRLQMLAVDTETSLWDVLVANKVLSPEGELLNEKETI